MQVLYQTCEIWMRQPSERKAYQRSEDPPQIVTVLTNPVLFCGSLVYVITEKNMFVNDFFYIGISTVINI